MRAKALEIAGGLLVGLVLFGAAMAGALALRHWSGPEAAVPAARVEMDVER